LRDTLPDDGKDLAFGFLGDLTNLWDRRTYLDVRDFYKDKIEYEQMMRLTRRQDEKLSILMKLIFAGLIAKESYDLVTREPSK
jgi:hypothetical protein